MKTNRSEYEDCVRPPYCGFQWKESPPKCWHHYQTHKPYQCTTKIKRKKEIIHTEPSEVDNTSIRLSGNLLPRNTNRTMIEKTPSWLQQKKTSYIWWKCNNLSGSYSHLPQKGKWKGDWATMELPIIIKWTKNDNYMSAITSSMKVGEPSVIVSFHPPPTNPTTHNFIGSW